MPGGSHEGHPCKFGWFDVRRIPWGTSQESPGTSLQAGVTWCLDAKPIERHRSVLQRSTVAIKSAVEAWDVLYCSKPVAKCALQVSKWLVAQCGFTVSVVCYQKVVVNRPSLLTMYILFIQGSRAASRDEVCVVVEIQHLDHNWS